MSFTLFFTTILLIQHSTLLHAAGWTDMYSMPYNNNPNTINSISCVNPTLCYVAGVDNAGNTNLLAFDGVSTFTPVSISTTPWSFLAVGALLGSNASSPVVIAGGQGIASAGLFYAASPLNFQAATDSWTFTSTTLDIRAEPHLLVATCVGTDLGYAYSTDNGKTFSAATPTVKVPAGVQMRYASVNAGSTYFTFGGVPTTTMSQESVYPITGRWGVDLNDGKTVKRTSSAMGPFAVAIAKTTTNGWSWTTVYADNSSSFLLGAIDCWNDILCVVVSEGLDTTQGGVRIQQTTDGTNWKVVYTRMNTASTSYSLKTVRYVSASEVWAAGGEDVVDGSGNGLFYRSLDGGATWSLASSVPNIFTITSIAMFANRTLGYAAGLTVNSMATIVKFTP